MSSVCERCRRGHPALSPAAFLYVVPGWIPVGDTPLGALLAGNSPVDRRESSLRIFTGVWCRRCRILLAAKCALISLISALFVPPGLLAVVRDLAGGYRFRSLDELNAYLRRRPAASGWRAWRFLAQQSRGRGTPPAAPGRGAL